MADDPKTLREMNIKVGGIESSLATQVFWLRWGIGGCFTLFLALGGGAFTLYHEIAGVDSKVSALNATMTAASARLDRMDATLASLPQFQAKLEQSAARIESAVKAHSEQIAKITPNVMPSIGLTPAEFASLRIAFKLERKNFQPSKYALGDIIPTSELQQMPDWAYQKIAPSLKGTKYYIDANGSMLITSASNAVLVIVEPA